MTLGPHFSRQKFRGEGLISVTAWAPALFNRIFIRGPERIAHCCHGCEHLWSYHTGGWGRRFRRQTPAQASCQVQGQTELHKEALSLNNQPTRKVQSHKCDFAYINWLGCWFCKIRFLFWKILNGKTPVQCFPETSRGFTAMHFYLVTLTGSTPPICVHWAGRWEYQLLIPSHQTLVR